MDLICFSHLRWNFVYQRPQHLIGRFTRYYRVFFIEEPVFHHQEDRYIITQSNENVWVITPALKITSTSDVEKRQRTIISNLMDDKNIHYYVLWYYTPMSLPISKHLKPQLTVYDCMDELSAFKFADPQIKNLEKQLFHKADIVFTGGYSLYQSKSSLHHNIYFFPSSIEKEHFAKARLSLDEPADQQNIPHPRLGFFGVIDERLDIDLIEKIAAAKPDWQFIFIGPVVKIDPAALPLKPNILYLGCKSYADLPAYLNGWDIALIPFALNEATRFISPTKTPEYLAAGKPVISTAIKDIVNPYGTKQLVHIIHNEQEFIEESQQILNMPSAKRRKWLDEVDEHLTDHSWDKTWYKMHELIKDELRRKQKILTLKKQAYV